MPAPPPDPSSTSITTPVAAAWGAAFAGLLATLKFIRDAFRSRRPVSDSLHTSLASLTVAVVKVGNEVETLRDVIIQGHHKRILKMEEDRSALIRRIDDLEERVARRYS